MLFIYTWERLHTANLDEVWRSACSMLTSWQTEIKKEEEMKRWMIWLLSPAKRILFFFFFPCRSSWKWHIYIWTVMMFYKHLFLFWKWYASISVQLSLFVHYFLSFLVSSVRPYQEREKKGRHRSIGVVLSLPAENTSCFCIHIHINQKICEYSRVVFSSSACIGQIWSRHYSYILILLFLRTRIECAYTYKKESSVVYIYKSIVRFCIQSFISRIYVQ